MRSSRKRRRTRAIKPTRTVGIASPVATSGLSTQIKAAAMERSETFGQMANRFIELLSEQPISTTPLQKLCAFINKRYNKIGKVASIEIDEYIDSKERLVRRELLDVGLPEGQVVITKTKHPDRFWLEDPWDGKIIKSVPEIMAVLDKMS